MINTFESDSNDNTPPLSGLRGLFKGQNEQQADANKQWAGVRKDAEALFGPYAKQFQDEPITFSEEDNPLYVLPQDVVNAVCHDILGPKSRGVYYGCTTQGDSERHTDEPFQKPQSRTYISNLVAYADFQDLLKHEMTHQLLVTARQLLIAKNSHSEKMGLPYVHPVMMWNLQKKIDELDKDLDEDDALYYDSGAGKAYISRNFEVREALKSIFDEYFALQRPNGEFVWW